MQESPLYRRVAVASTFSPRFEQVLAEAKRICQRFGAELSLIYVGEECDDVAARFRETLTRLELPGDSPIHYQSGDPAEAILRAIDQNQIELIVAGALEKEVVLHPFLGNVARRLLRDASGSVMLFTRPELEPRPLRNIVFVAEYTDHDRDALRRALRLAASEKSERLYVVRVITTFDEARAARDSGRRPEQDEEEKLEQFVLSMGHTDVPIEIRCIRGNTGFAVADFVKSVDADLLVIPADREKNAGQLPPKLQWLADVIPCNLWLIR
ncbi:MAG: universal stress protein [Verrucomicrobia bacterium]|nr:universal stress protein [Verrucomicrobiota bacterium]